MKKLYLYIVVLLNSISFLHSQNNWQLLNPQPTYLPGFQIDFIDDNHGFILTNAHLLETFDFGESWTINSNYLHASEFDFSENLGVVVTGVPSYNKITFDSAKTWQNFNTPESGFHTAKVFESHKIYLTNSSKLHITDDYGDNWLTYDLPFNQVIQSHFINEQIGFICSGNGKIAKTVNGGESWDLIFTDNINFLSMYFVNENLGFAYADNHTLFKTINGGASWTTKTLDYEMYDFHFVNDQVGFGVGETGKIYKTINAGESWIPRGYNNVIYGSPRFAAVYFKSENEGIISGQRGMILKTNNSASTWSPYSFLYDPIWGGCLFDEVGYVHTLEKLYKTVDGGQNWSTTNKPSNSGMIRKIQFFDDNNGIMLAGKPNYDDITKLYKTIDGGQTWSILNSDEDARKSTIQFINESLGFAYATSPFYRMQITTNGGQSFQDLDYESEYFDINFVSENIGYSIGYGWNRIFKTIDGGLTWNVHYIDNNGIKDIEFLNAEVGYMLTSRIYKTIDGGNTWIMLPSLGEYIDVINFYTTEKGYAIDDDNVVYHTINGGESWNISTSFYNEIKNIKITGQNVLLYGDYGLIAKTNTNHMSVNDFPINPKYEIQVYPNPSSNLINIKIDQSLTINRLEIYDFTGKLISQKLTNETNYSIKNLSAGIYILKVYTKEKETFSTKLIVKK